MDKVYLTTTLPYVNADPHIGFALEIVQADIVARWGRLSGKEVFFNTGTDEHGLKIWRNALEAGKNPKEYVDEYAARFDLLKEALNLSYDNFIRTTDPKHISAAREFWRRCAEGGHIYKKNYSVKYCVGCELEKTDSELEDGRCPIHPNLEPEIIEEENYFFKFSAFRDKLLLLYEKNPDFVVPSYRFNEIKAFAERGFEDFSVSRLKEKMPWGVPVPGDEAQVMYVWFDALVSYVSAIGWPDDMAKFGKWWPVIQFAGKDNLRQQSAMWQAMLMAAGLPPSKQIVIHGFMTSGGQKMSKSLGNVVNPFDLVKEYGADAVRYYLARHVHPFEDSDFTMKRFKEAYNANLANGLGNLLSRIMKMATSNDVVFQEGWMKEKNIFAQTEHFYNEQKKEMENFNFQQSADAVWGVVSYLDGFIQKEQPFKKIKSDKETGERDIKYLLCHLMAVSNMLLPIMPKTAEIMEKTIKENKMPETLFPRKD